MKHWYSKVFENHCFQQCCRSGSMCCWAFGTGFISTRYGYGSGSFYYL